MTAASDYAAATKAVGDAKRVVKEMERDLERARELLRQKLSLERKAKRTLLAEAKGER